MAEPMSIQAGHQFCSITGDENNFTLKYRDRFLKTIEHTFTSRPTLYGIISERIEQLVTEQLTDAGTIKAVLKTCKEQILKQQEKQNVHTRI